MRITALLSWFDESPTMLAASLASLIKVGVDHVVAVDGAYALMPGGRAVSGIDQTRVVSDVCAAMGFGLTLYQPTGPFRGNEIEKRNLSLRLALTITTPEDWLFIIDADEVVTKARGNLRGVLKNATLDVATTGLTHAIDPLSSDEAEFVSRCAGGVESVSPVPRLIRALPSLRYESNHYTILDGARVLCPLSPLSEDALDLTGVIRMEHRKHLRDAYRAQRAATFYGVRDAMQIENVHQPSNHLLEAPA